MKTFWILIWASTSWRPSICINSCSDYCAMNNYSIFTDSESLTKSWLDLSEREKKTATVYKGNEYSITQNYEIKLSSK